MGRSIVYCPICGCPFEDVLENCSSEWVYDSTNSPRSPTKVRKDRPTLTSQLTYLHKYLENFRVIGKSTFTYVLLQPAQSARPSQPQSLTKTHLILCYFNQDMRQKPPRHRSESHLQPTTPNFAPAPSKAEIRTVPTFHAQEGKNGCCSRKDPPVPSFTHCTRPA